MRDRIERALTERLYLVSRHTSEAEKSPHNEFDVPEHQFVVLGSTGNLYTVKINLAPSCSCPDFGKGNFCKHILFVYLKVLRVPRDSPVIGQRELHSSELLEIVTSVPDDPTVLADKRVRAEYDKIANPGAASTTDESRKKQKPVEGDCPICFDPMLRSDEIDFCQECGNNVHKGCWQKWSQTKRSMHIEETCVYCRAVWANSSPAAGGTGAAILNEGYVNLASLQPETGIHRREYHSWRRYGSYDSYSGYEYD